MTKSFYGFLALLGAGDLVAQTQAEMRINTASVKNTVSENLHGIFFEEISHGGEGGLYGELIQNRGFEEIRLPPGSVREGDFINPNPNKLPHYNLRGKASDFKLRLPKRSDWPFWSLQNQQQSPVGL